MVINPFLFPVLNHLFVQPLVIKTAVNHHRYGASMAAKCAATLWRLMNNVVSDEGLLVVIVGQKPLSSV